MNLKQVIEVATKEKVLVVKHGGEFVRNPSLSETRSIIGNYLEASFAKKIKTKGSGPYNYVMQFHIRGRSVHVDFRFQIGNGRVTGYTIVTPMSLTQETHKKIAEKAMSLAQKLTGDEPQKWQDLSDNVRKQIASKIAIPKSLFLDEFEDKFTSFIRNWNKKNIVEQKTEQDESWFHETHRIIPPGFIGATKEEWGAIVSFDKGEIEFGTMKTDYHEMWLKSDSGLFTGKIVVTWLPREQVEKDLEDSGLGKKGLVGFLFSTKSTQPYVLSQRAIKEDFMPPSGESFLPSSFEGLVPGELKFWKLDNKKEKRNELADWCKEHIQFYERSNEKDTPAKDKMWVKK